MSDPNGVGGGAESIKSSSSDTKGISLASILDIFWGNEIGNHFQLKWQIIILISVKWLDPWLVDAEPDDVGQRDQQRHQRLRDVNDIVVR